MPKIKNVFVYKPEQLPDDYSAMRGPCPEGFHIPSFDEIVALRDMFNTMGLLSGGTSNFTSYLKIPKHHRLKGDLTRANDTASTIRMCNENGGIGAWHIMGSGMGIYGSGYNSRGVPIRPFKDISIAPESSWTTVYDGSSTAVGAGVFWDTTNGLISTSDDGLTWITIADKNLGATTVSTGRVGNDITKCGNFYQRGNNYGFTATVSTTSSTKVDTTGYGPGNYYESSTWITTSDSRWFEPFNGNLRGGTTGVVPGGTVLVEKTVYPGSKGNYYYSDSSFNEYQKLVNEIGSINFLDSGSRFRFNYGVYIGNRTALDFDGTTMRTINLDNLTYTSKSSSINGKVRYFGDNRILTRIGIADFEGNIITSFSYDNITPGLGGEVRARSGSNIYRGEVSGDNIAFTLIGTITDFYRGGGINYARGGLYYAPSVDYWADSKKGGWTLFDANTYAKTYIPLADNYNYNSMNPSGGAGADGKYYQMGHRNYGGSSESLDISRRGKLHKLGTTDEGLVGSSVSNNSWLAYGDRFGHLIGNFVSGGMNSNNGTGNGYCSNNYFIDTEGNATLVQSNAFAYDTGILGVEGFIDEKGWLYPRTYGGGSGVILKPDKTITNLNWKNPYLWR